MNCKNNSPRSLFFNEILTKFSSQNQKYGIKFPVPLFEIMVALKFSLSLAIFKVFTGKASEKTGAGPSRWGLLPEPKTRSNELRVSL